MLILVLRRLKEEYAPLVSLLLGIGFTVCAMGILAPTVEYLRTLTGNTDESELFTLLFKSAGIAVITTLAADLCRDCGERRWPEKPSFAEKA